MIRGERHPTNSDATIYFFVGWTDRCHKGYTMKILKKQLEDTTGNVKLTMELSGMKPGSYSPFKYYTRTTMSLAELQAQYPDSTFHGDDCSTKTTLGAFVLHKKAVWRSSYRSVSDLSNAKECPSEKILCFIERKDHESANCFVHQRANFLIETFKAHPVAGKYLQGLIVYKNIQTENVQDSFHCPDTIVEFAVHPKTGKYFIALLNSFCSTVKDVDIVFGSYKRKHILGDVEWV